MKGVKQTETEASENGVNESTPVSELVVPEVTVATETQPTSSDELSQTSMEGGEVGGEDGKIRKVIDNSSDWVNVETYL